MTQNTRSEKRAKVVSLLVRYKSTTVDEFIESNAHDVSRDGIFVKSPTPFATGTLLRFELRLATDTSFVSGVGRVVWKREPTQATADKPAGMGLAFVRLDDASRVVIERLVTEKPEAGRAFASEPAVYGDFKGEESLSSIGPSPLLVSESVPPTEPQPSVPKVAIVGASSGSPVKPAPAFGSPKPPRINASLGPETPGTATRVAGRPIPAKPALPGSVGSRSSEGLPVGVPTLPDFDDAIVSSSGPSAPAPTPAKMFPTASDIDPEDEDNDDRHEGTVVMAAAALLHREASRDPTKPVTELHDNPLFQQHGSHPGIAANHRDMPSGERLALGPPSTPRMAVASSSHMMMGPPSGSHMMGPPSGPHMMTPTGPMVAPSSSSNLMVGPPSGHMMGWPAAAPPSRSMVEDELPRRRGGIMTMLLGVIALLLVLIVVIIVGGGFFLFKTTAHTPVAQQPTAPTATTPTAASLPSTTPPTQVATAAPPPPPVAAPPPPPPPVVETAAPPPAPPPAAPPPPAPVVTRTPRVGNPVRRPATPASPDLPAWARDPSPNDPDIVPKKP